MYLAYNASCVGSLKVLNKGLRTYPFYYLQLWITYLFFLQSTVGIHYKIFLYWRNGKIFCQSFLICWNWFLNFGSKLWTKQALHDRSYLENELDTLNDESWTKVFKWFYKFWWQHLNTKLGYKHFLNGTMYSVVCATKKK